MVYRKDIDFLRALAVISVIYYHLGSSRFSGGYIGVDIFFVISGYLITNITSSTIDSGKFSFLTFYSRRILRLMPVLLLTTLAVIGLGYYLLDPNQFINVGGSTKYTGILQTNLFFLENSQDYFNQGTLKGNPLLHLWSLAIEEQFYLFFPIILWFSQKFLKSELKRFVALLTLLLISFFYCQWLMKSNASAAFYSLPSRAWELLAGGCLALGIKAYPTSIRSSYANFLYIGSLIGLFIVIGRYNHSTKFPGIAAIFPVFLTGVLIYSGLFINGYLKKIVEFKAIVFIGLISYSLYLWHWPVIVFAKSPFLNISLTKDMQFLLIAIISISSYFIIENPIRKIKQGKVGNIITIFCALLTLLVLYILGSVIYTEKIKQKFSDEYYLQLPKPNDVPYRRWQVKYSDIDSIKNGLSPVILGDKDSAPEFIIIGDSYAGMWGDGLSELLKSRNKSAVMLAMESCSFLWDLNRISNPECLDLNKARQIYLQKSKIKKVVLASSWRLFIADKAYNYYEKSQTSYKKTFRKAVKDTINKLPDKEIYIIPSHVMSNMSGIDIYAKNLRTSSEVLYGHRFSDYEQSNPWFLEMNNVLVEVKVSHGNVTILNPNDKLCPNNQCYILNDGKVLMHDWDHLNLYGSRFLVDVFSPVL